MNNTSLISQHSFKMSFPLLLFVLFSSCVNTKKVTYFQDLKDSVKIHSQDITTDYEVQIQPDDVLGISINSINPQAAAIFNPVNNSAQLTSTPYMSGTVSGSSSSNYGDIINGYLVNKQGTINFPVLGEMKVAGSTISQLRDTLMAKLDKYLQTPIVNVRLLNYKITVLGEVTHPATYSVASERITVIDAISMAGDLTIYGKRENVLLIREVNGKRNFIRLNLDSSKLFQSPYYYLKQNDIIYVEPGKAKVETLQATTFKTIALAASVISVLVLVIIRLKI